MAEEYAQVAKVGCDSPLTILRFAELRVLNREVLSEIALVLAENCGVYFVVGLFTCTICLRHEENAACFAERCEPQDNATVAINAARAKAVLRAAFPTL